MEGPKKPSTPVVTMCWLSIALMAAETVVSHDWKTSPVVSPTRRASLISSHAKMAGSSLYATPVMVLVRFSSVSTKKRYIAVHVGLLKKSACGGAVSGQEPKHPQLAAAPFLFDSASVAPAALAQATYCWIPPKSCHLTAQGC